MHAGIYLSVGTVKASSMMNCICLPTKILTSFAKHLDNTPKYSTLDGE